MPADMRKYPGGWKAFSNWVRFTRAHAQCECVGHCGMHRGRRCVELHHRPATWAKGIVRLSVTHLCHCQPICKDPRHVIAACQRCHLRIDIAQHLHTRRTNRLARLRQAGQLTFEPTWERNNRNDGESYAQPCTHHIDGYDQKPETSRPAP